MKLLALALKNLYTQKTRTVLNILAIIMAIATLFVFMSLSAGIKQNTIDSRVSEAPLTQIKVRPIADSASLFQLVSTNTNLLYGSDIEQIETIPGVINIDRETQYRNIASIEMSILNESFITDGMILGVPYNFVKNEVTAKEAWENPVEPYPIVISTKLINLYNYAVANSTHLPTIKKEYLVGTEMDIHLNHSSFFPAQGDEKQTVRGIIVGASDKVNFLGITMPEELIHQWNVDRYGEGDQHYLELFVETESAEINSRVAKDIEALGYQTSYIQKDLSSIEQTFFYMQLAFSIISLVIVFTAAISITTTFMSAITERRREIGILRAVGATQRDILVLFLEEAALLGIIGGSVGVLLGIAVDKTLDSMMIGAFNQFENRIDSLFRISPELIIFCIIFAGLVSMLAASIPARKAAKLHPIDALRS